MTETVTDVLSENDIVKVADSDSAEYIGVPVGALAVVRRAVRVVPTGSSFVDVEWAESSITASPEGWNTDRFVKVASLSPVGTVVYLTKDSADGKNGIEAYRDNQWPLRGVVETAPYVPAPATLDRGYTVRLDDGSLVFATQRMIESTHPDGGATPVSETAPVPSWKDTEIERLGGEVRRLQDQINRMNAWKDDLVSDAHQYADDNSLCSAFDDFMTEHDLPAREADYEVEVYFTVSATVSVRAQDEDSALEQAESEAMSLRSDIDYHLERNMDMYRVDTDFDRTGEASRQN